MTRYLVPAVIILALLVLVACSVGGNSNTETTSPSGSNHDLGKLKTFFHTRSGGMIGENYEIRITREEDGSVWLYEAQSDATPPRAEPITYRYRLSDDALEKIESHLKENGLWVEEPFKTDPQIIIDGYDYSWSFQTEKRTYPIYKGMVLSKEVSEGLQALQTLIGEMREGLKREKDPTCEPFTEDDIIGFSVFKEQMEASIVVHPQKGRISVDHEDHEVNGTTPKALLAEIKELYLRNKDAWGEQILDCYPMEFETETADAHRMDRYRVYLAVKKEDSDKPYAFILKFGGDTVPTEMEAFMDHMIKILQSQTRKQVK